jgi:hypothetical protein
VVDIWQYRQWAQPMVWIGVNPITIYLAVNLIDFGEITQRLVGPSRYYGVYGPLVVALGSLILEILVLNFLYRRRIFLRL